VFFWRKQPAETPPATAPENQRGAYRRGNSRGQPLELTLRVAGIAPFRVELADLSATGAGLRLPRFDRLLTFGERVELAISSGMRQEVLLGARVVSMRRDGPGHVRYGVEFLAPEAVLRGLDPSYFKHFNRRRERRVPPSLDRRPAVSVELPGAVIAGSMCDISEGGVAITVRADAVGALAELTSVVLRFRLPGLRDEFCLRATLRHRSRGRLQAQLGFEFDRSDRGYEEQGERLVEFVRERTREAEAWEWNAG
jgi:hypothetical protein